MAKRNIKYTIEEVRKYFEEANCVLLSDNYLNAHAKLDYICNCGNKSSIKFTNFKSGKRCKKCGVKKVTDQKRYTYEEVVKIFQDRNCELLESKYVNNGTHMKYKCSCGNQSKIVLYSFLNGNRCKKCGTEKIKGENHPRFNPDLTTEDRIRMRGYEEYHIWRKQVFTRDKFTCQCCGDKKSGNKVSHHLDGYNWAVERRTDVSNGITLCNNCHTDFHSVYGYGDNTKVQFNDWLRNKRISNEDLGA